ncbi:hypothetical protein DPMN_105039 [Dreissena polymorpha]|uniref:Uncharacterized protein n=1 Tax=Dreissena polymorpha TaxID=45954 RepID=A0A9D4K225_DREPO|nr:hypothetical protein DPMN_105039 [Dreissena polymorpha]
MTQAYITAKKSSSYEVVATLNGPKLKNRLALKYDNRANKNVNTKVVLQYEIMKKEWSDTISVDGRLINNVMKNKQIIKGSR